MSLLRINLHPSARQLRIFSVAWLGFCAWLGFACRGRGQGAGALGCWLAGVMVLLIGLGWPARVRLLYVGLCYLTFPIGFVVSAVVLTLIYYGVLTPIGLILRLCGHDPLRRRLDAQASTYWQRRSGPRDPESYFRQH